MKRLPVNNPPREVSDASSAWHRYTPFMLSRARVRRSGLLGLHPLSTCASLAAPPEISVRADGGHRAANDYASIFGAKVSVTYPPLYGPTGTTMVLDKMVLDASSGRYDVLLVSQVGALGRDMWDALSSLDRLRRRVCVHLVGRGPMSLSDLAPASFKDVCLELLGEL